MKLRCVTHSIRIRVRKSDLAVLRSEGVVEDQVSFGGDQVLVFGLCLVEKLAEVTASFEAGKIEVRIPASVGEKWMDSPQVGIHREMILEKQKKLDILIEKDFP